MSQHTASKYQVCCEISGPTAMWTRPDTGDAPVSYPAPSFAAVKGIFESIVWLNVRRRHHFSARKKKHPGRGVLGAGCHRVEPVARKPKLSHLL
ncbi:MAG: CRISPR-associated protein Cas5 [Planctomycetaceae bacterium]|nr:CRISPR-associated protein Cas5 [Planctomycetaceae bacterium]